MTVLALRARSAPALDLPRDAQRALIASTPPATPWLRSHELEDHAVFALTRGDRLLEVDRIDSPLRTSSDLTDAHIGAIRLFDRGLLSLHSYTDTHATWVLRDVNAESDALRLLRRRTLGFLPYNMGYRELTPETMTGPELVALLVWHYRHTGVHRLDVSISASGEGWLVEHHADGTIEDSSFAPHAHVEDFESHTRTIHPHLDKPDHVFDPAVLNVVMTNLSCRISPDLFGETRLRVNLNTWHLLPHGHAPTSFTETLPLNVQDAVTVLGGPVFATSHDFVAWAEGALVMNVMCRFGDDAVKRRNGRRHLFRLDPHTHEAHTIASANLEQSTALETIHFLSAFDPGPPPRCLEVAQAWDTTLGEVTNSKTYTWEEKPDTVDVFPVRREYRTHWSVTQADRILAIHWAARMVQYLDAGFTGAQVAPVFGFDIPTAVRLLSTRSGHDDAAFAAYVLAARQRVRRNATPVTASF